MKNTTDNVTPKFKVSDPVFITFFKPGLQFGPIIRKQPTFLSLEGVVMHIHQPGETNFLSIQIPKWPLRYFEDEKKCFKTRQEVEADVATKNGLLANHLRQQQAW